MTRLRVTTVTAPCIVRSHYSFSICKAKLSCNDDIRINDSGQDIGPTVAVAVERRARQELGLSVDPRFLFKFSYRASFQNIGTEYELCSVFTCVTTQEPNVNASEIAEWRWTSPDKLDREIEIEPSMFTPWLMIEWKRLRTDFLAEFEP